MENNLDNQNQNQNHDQNQNQDNLDNQTKTFTKEEVDLMLQKEADRRVSSARAKFEEEYKQKLEQEKSEAEKLAQLTEAEKTRMEIEKEKAKFEEERKQFLREKLELQTVKELSALNLPTQFSSFILSNHESADEIKKSIDTFKTEWEKAIQEHVDKQLQGTTPRVTSKKSDSNVTKEQFQKMNYMERMAIYEQDKNLYDQLSG